MDISQLARLGKVGGVAAIALGVAAMLLGPVVGQIGAVPEGWRGPVMTLLVVGGVALAVLGLVGWILEGRANRQVARTEGDDSPAVNIDRTKGKMGGGQTAGTAGARSPASNLRE